MNNQNPQFPSVLNSVIFSGLVKNNFKIFEETNTGGVASVQLKVPNTKTNSKTMKADSFILLTCIIDVPKRERYYLENACQKNNAIEITGFLSYSIGAFSLTGGLGVIVSSVLPIDPAPLQEILAEYQGTPSNNPINTPVNN